MQEDPARTSDPHAEPGGDLVGGGLLAVAVVVGVLSTAALLVMPYDVPLWSPWALGAAVVLMVVLRGRHVTLGLGTDAQVGISPTTSVLFAAALLVPAPLLPILALLRLEPTGKGWRREAVNLSLDLVTLAAAVGVAGLVRQWSFDSLAPDAVTTVAVALAAAVVWWMVSTLALSLVLWSALDVPPALSPVVQPSAVRLLASQLVIGVCAVVLLEASPWYAPVVALLAWLVVRMSSDQKQMRVSGNDRRTGMARYEVFLEAAELELARSLRTGGAVSVLMVDLDHFKLVNKQHGHANANDVLTETAARIRGTLRITDVAGRYGGEEFCVLLPDTDAGRAVVAAERIRSVIGGSPASAGGEPVVVTASIGVAQLLTGETVPEALDRADQALSEAKDRGRDQVRLAIDLRAR